ncbi:hypothetical protein Prudu_012923 [Prunus dulcis]|uniref:CCHC-type domain-containing protein n=1 Tax=Prunus dulcis TaxID=3755 RepID=A0A4Y1REA3_PRUDU|nr:hypothetical protein Prudu_012923 [Prunus dulcis]
MTSQNLWRFVDGSHPCPSPTLSPSDKSESSTLSSVNLDYVTWFQTDQSLISILRVTLSESVLPQAKSLADELTAIQEPVSNSDLVTYVLRGLGLDYQMIVMAILNFPPLPSFLDLRTRLLAFEGQQALVAQMALVASLLLLLLLTSTVAPATAPVLFSGPGQHFHHAPRHSLSSHGLLGPPLSHQSIQCWNCNQFGHVQAKCPSPRPFASMHVASSSHPNWYLDSGATNHMTHDSQQLHSGTPYASSNQVEMGSNMELVWPEAEAYSSRVNNCSHANSSLAAIRAKLSAEQLEKFKTSCFGHLLNIDKIQFSRQIVHGVVLRRVAGQGLHFGEVPEVSSGESDEIRLQKRYFIDEGITCNALEEAFMRCTEEDDIYKLALVYFAELVVLGRDKHLNINLNYLTLVEDLDAFNRYPWGSVSFDKTQDSLFSAPTKYVKSFENEEGRGKGKSKVTGTSRRNEKGKKDKHGEAQRSGWSFKGFTYAFQIWVYELIPRMADLNYCKVVDPTAIPRILRWRTTTSVPEMRKLNNYFFQSKELRALCPSEEEMRQPYWSWPQDRPAVVSAESIPSSCGDLDELNKVVSFTTTKKQKDDGKSPSCIRFFNGRGIHRHLFPHKPRR